MDVLLAAKPVTLSGALALAGLDAALLCLAAARQIYITHWSVRFLVYTPVDVNRQGTFGELLREYRYRAGLSQELLAERAGLSLRGIQDLERGVRRSPYPATASRVADALELDESDRQYLMQAARPCARSRAPVNAAPPFRLHAPSDANTNLNKCAVVY